MTSYGCARSFRPYLPGEQSELDSCSPSGRPDTGPRQRRQPYREALGASEAGYQQGGNLPVDERPELTIMLRMGGISLQGQNPSAPSGERAPRQATRRPPSTSDLLITVGAGFIGSGIVEELLERGETVRVIDNFSTGRRDNPAPLLKDIQLLGGDIRSLDVRRSGLT